MIRILWATACLVAIFAMHGLAAHAGSHDPAPISTTSTAHSAHAAVDDAEPTAGEAPAHGEPGHDMAVLGLCAAVLATSAILLLVHLGRRPRSGLLALLPRALVVSSRAVGVRSGHAPPDLHALSVLRC